MLAFLLGAILAWAGNIRDNAWMLWAHIAAAVLGVAALIPFVWKKAAREGGNWLDLQKRL